MVPGGITRYECSRPADAVQRQADESADLRALPDTTGRGEDHQEGGGATINDVVMAECAGGLRSWLMARNELPDKPLTASIPVSIRDESQKGAMGNQVSMIITDLPTDVADPLERIKAVHESMMTAKEVHDAAGGDDHRFSDLAPPPRSSSRGTWRSVPTSPAV